MSYQSYLSNRDLQQSLQEMFGQVQTEDEVTQNEEQAQDQQSKQAFGEQKKGEQEAGGESTTIGLGELAGSQFFKSFGSKIFGGAVDAVKEKLSSALSDAKSQISDSINSTIESATGDITSRISSARGQLQSVAEGAESDATELSSNLNVAGRSFFSRILGGTNSTTTAPSEGTSFQNGLLDNEEFGEQDVELATSTIRSGFTQLTNMISSSGATSALPTTSGLPSVADLDELTMRGVAYSGESGAVELPSVTRASAVGTSAEAEVATPLTDDLATTATTALTTGAEAVAGAETGEIATGILAGLEVPGLDVIAGLAGVAFGLYDLFHHSSRDAPPPPPSASAPVGVTQEISTVQAGI